MPQSRNPQPKPSGSFTSWKLDIINAAAADPRIPPTYFRFLVRVIKGLDEASGFARLGDDVIADEVHGFAQQSTCYRARRKLAELGYLQYESGRGSRATRYRVSDAPLPAIITAIDQARERRNAERNARDGAFKRRPSKPASVQGKAPSQPCKSHTSKPASVQVDHPVHSPLELARQQQDVTHRQPEPKLMCLDCGALASWRDPPNRPQGNLFCDDCYQEHTYLGLELIRPAEEASNPNGSPSDAYLRASKGA